MSSLLVARLFPLFFCFFVVFFFLDGSRVNFFWRAVTRLERLCCFYGNRPFSWSAWLLRVWFAIFKCWSEMGRIVVWRFFFSH